MPFLLLFSLILQLILGASTNSFFVSSATRLASSRIEFCAPSFWLTIFKAFPQMSLSRSIHSSFYLSSLALLIFPFNSFLSSLYFLSSSSILFCSLISNRLGHDAFVPSLYYTLVPPVHTSLIGRFFYECFIASFLNVITECNHITLALLEFLAQ